MSIRVFVSSFLVLLVPTIGCITRSGGNLPPITPRVGTLKPVVEQTVGDFEFSLEGGKMVTSNKAGRLLNDEILKRWEKKGYIAQHSYVPSSEFTNRADYNLTLSGSQYGDSSIAGQILSGLTLLIIPYTVNTSYDIQYVFENVRTGQRYSASVEDSVHTTVELLLFLVFPISGRGQAETMDAMADHLYQQLVEKGAFSREVEVGSMESRVREDSPEPAPAFPPPDAPLTDYESIAVSVTGAGQPVDEAQEDLIADLEARLIDELRGMGFSVRNEADAQLVLNAVVKEYSGGNSALRLVVGFGAGQASLQTSVNISDARGPTKASFDVKEKFSGMEMEAAQEKFLGNVKGNEGALAWTVQKTAKKIAAIVRANGKVEEKSKPRQSGPRRPRAR